MNRTHATPRSPDGRSNGRWLVVSAWPPELAKVRAAWPCLPPAQRDRLVLASLGVGLIEAAIETSRLLVAHRPAAVLLIGTAGVYPGHQRALPIGAAAAVGAMVLLPQVPPGRDVVLPDLLPARERSSRALLLPLVDTAHLPVADVACPLAITASIRAARAAARLSGCALENLEAFAVARAAAAAGIPFAGILGVSNAVGPDGHRQWRHHARAAAAAACDAALAFLAALGETGGDSPTEPSRRRSRGPAGRRRPRA